MLRKQGQCMPPERMAGSISIRKSIRWLPDAAREPTSTLVLTSPEKRYVDARILKDGEEAAFEDNLPLSRLDWAIAGTCSSSIVQVDGKSVSRSQFEHWIDSRTSKPEEATDQGDMYPQADGTTLERGHMVNPDTGLDTEYEEVWDDADVFSDGDQVCVVLRYEDGPRKRGLVVRLGQHCQGIVRIGDELALARWEVRERPVCAVKMGRFEVPCEMTFMETFAVGDEVRVGDLTWKVVEVA